MKGELALNPWEEEAKIYFSSVAGLAWTGLGPLLLVGFTMGNTGIYGGDYGGDDGIVIILVREAIGEVDIEGVGIEEVVTTIEEGVWSKMDVTN